MPEPEKPLLPRTAAGTTIATTVVGSLLAGLGFIGTELISLERQVGEGSERVVQSVLRVEGKLDDIEDDVDRLRDRVAVIESHQLDRLERESTNH